MKRLPMFEAGRLRHRIDIEQQVTTQDTSGDPVTTWTPWATNVPAEIVPLSAKEFVAGQGIVGQVVARIVIRQRFGLDPTMRITHTLGEGTAQTVNIYNIAGILADPETGLEYLTIPVSRGVNEG